jgi:hypothetical protein
MRLIEPWQLVCPPGAMTAFLSSAEGFATGDSFNE